RSRRRQQTAVDSKSNAVAPLIDRLDLADGCTPSCAGFRGRRSQVQRRGRPLRSPTWSSETVYAITNMNWRQARADLVAQAIRGHWQIESLHWIRDVTFGEDLPQIRTGNGPAVMATLRNTAVSRHRLDGATKIASACRHTARGACGLRCRSSGRGGHCGADALPGDLARGVPGECLRSLRARLLPTRRGRRAQRPARITRQRRRAAPPGAGTRRRPGAAADAAGAVPARGPIPARVRGAAGAWPHRARSGEGRAPRLVQVGELAVAGQQLLR
ncbi:MAG: transposase, family, partial [Pseudonocardia sp.]|nr:transposase, family [Pseudonocardia sp.]